MASESAKQIESVKGDGSIAITALGMACSLGLSHIHACAAARAGLTRISELKTLNVAMSPGFGRETVVGPPELKGHSVPEIGQGYTGVAKVLALAAAGLKDLLATRSISREEQRSTHLILNLSDGVVLDAAGRMEEASQETPAEASELPSAVWRRESADVALRLARRLGLGIPPDNLRVIHGGHVGVFEAIITAMKLLQEGTAQRVVIGGVESCVEPAFVVLADQLNVLRTNQNPVGFIPGEAAAFFLLQRWQPARESLPTGVALVESVAITADPFDTFSEEMPLGEGLSLALDQAIQKAGEPPDFLLGDLNGLERRASDWGHALIRMSQRAPLGSVPLWLPALSFGETGGATVAAAVNLAIRAWQRGYAPGQRAAIWAASDNGRRGAAVLRYVA